MTYLANAFSLSMLSSDECVLKIRRLTLSEAKEMLKNGFISAVGHQATADLLSTLLAMNVPMNRVQVSLNPGDRVVVFQLKTRLAEGKVLSREELEKLEYDFFLVELN